MEFLLEQISCSGENKVGLRYVREPRNRQSHGQDTVIKNGQKKRKKTGKPQFEPMTKTNPMKHSECQEGS